MIKGIFYTKPILIQTSTGVVAARDPHVIAVGMPVDVIGMGVGYPEKIEWAENKKYFVVTLRKQKPFDKNTITMVIPVTPDTEIVYEND